MANGSTVPDNPGDSVIVHTRTDWNTPPKTPENSSMEVYSSRKTRRTIDEVSENHHHAIDQANHRNRP